jgi:hypothetical protein
MQTEPSKADSPGPKRRWFQFRLRTLLIGVGVLLLLATAGWCAKETWIGLDRHALLSAVRAHGGEYQPHLGAPSRMSFVRRLCGDECVVVIWRPPDNSGPTENEIRARFPKVQILVASDERP